MGELQRLRPLGFRGPYVVAKSHGPQRFSSRPPGLWRARLPENPTFPQTAVRGTRNFSAEKHGADGRAVLLEFDYRRKFGYGLSLCTAEFWTLWRATARSAKDLAGSYPTEGMFDV